MKQIVQDIRAKAPRVVDVPIPKPGAGMALVQTAVSIVSAGTERMQVEFAEKNLLGKARARPDLVRQTIQKAQKDGLLSTYRAVKNRLGDPIPLGYSSAGTIIEVGDGLVGFKAGDRVACAGGGYAVHAEYAVVPKNLLAPLPDAVEFESGAYATLGAIALHAFRLAEAQIGDHVAIMGLGLLGILVSQIAKAAGCSVVGVDLSESRVEFGRQFGITAVHRDDVLEVALGATHAQGSDAIVICASTDSNDPIELAGELARDRAKVVALGAVGLKIPRKIYYEKEISLIVSRSYGPGRYDPSYEEGGHDYPIGYVRWTEGRNLSAFVDLVAAGQVDVTKLTTHRFPIEDAPQAYELIKQGESATLGVAITYPTEHADVTRTLEIASGSVGASKTIRVGVLGAGNFAKSVMLPILQRSGGSELVSIAAGSGLHAKDAAGRFGFARAATDEAELLQDDGLNALVILTRHDLHARQIIAGLQAGKHVFSEKPLAITRQQMDEIAEALKGCERILMVGFNRRFSAYALQLKSFLRSVQSPLVMNYRVNAGSLPASHWLLDPEIGGGRIIGECCHFIDLMTFLAGSNPVRIHAVGLGGEEGSSEENVAISIGFVDGSVGTLLYTSLGDARFPKERLEVFGGGRAAVLDNFRSLEMVSDGRRVVKRSRLNQDKGHQAEWQAFMRAVLDGGPPPIPFDELFAVTNACFAAVESLRGQEPVDLVHFASS